MAVLDGGRKRAAVRFQRDLQSLAVNSKGEALVTYQRSDGKVRHLLAWGAVNANAPTDQAVPQVHFKYDYSGGWDNTTRAPTGRRSRTSAHPTTGPLFPYFVAGCKAPDGSYWAIQSWQRALPLLGFDPWKPQQTAFELPSHWSGELPKLEVYGHWTYGGAWQGLFGRLTYGGSPVHGFGATGDGNPRDRYGRNVYIDTFNSVYGAGWKRESGSSCTGRPARSVTASSRRSRFRTTRATRRARQPPVSATASP